MTTPEHTHELAAPDHTATGDPAGTDPASNPEPAEKVDDAQFRTLIGRGPIAPLPVWRRVYTTLDIHWPGEAEIRRRHRVADTHTGPQPPSPVRQLRWPTPPDRRRPHRGIDTNQQHQPSSPVADRSAPQRLADTLGWDHLPTLTPEEQRESDLEFNVAQAEARRLYGLECEQFERGWDAALDLAGEVVRDARDGHDAQNRIRQLAHQVSAKSRNNR